MIDVRKLRMPYKSEETRKWMNGDIGRGVAIESNGQEYAAILKGWYGEWLAVKVDPTVFPLGYGIVHGSRCRFIN